MFDLGFSELAVIGVVALIVIGPEQLPRVARTVGHVLGRLRRYVSDVKSDINREMELSDLKRMQEEIQTSAANFEQEMQAGVNALASETGQVIAPVAAAVEQLAATQVQPHLPEMAEPPSDSEPAASTEGQPDLFAGGASGAGGGR